MCPDVDFLKRTIAVWLAGDGMASLFPIFRLRRMRQLEDQNNWLKKIVADLTLDKAMLQDVLSKCMTRPVRARSFRRCPKTIRVDQSSEFISRDLGLWAYQRGVELDFSHPGKPTDTDVIEKPLYAGLASPRGRLRHREIKRA